MFFLGIQNKITFNSFWQNYKKVEFVVLIVCFSAFVSDKT